MAWTASCALAIFLPSFLAISFILLPCKIPADGLLSSADALLLAHDYRQAAALAKYVIFVRGDLSNWPACSRKLGLAAHVAEIKAM